MTRLIWAVALHGDHLRAWQAAALNALLEHDGASPAGRIDVGDPPEPTPHGRALSAMVGTASSEQLVPLPEPLRTLGDPEAADVILWMGDGAPPAALSSNAPRGVWHFVLGDARNGQGNPPYFWELLRGEPVVTLSLCQQHESGSKLLYEGVIRTIPESLSATRDRALSVGQQFLVKACRDALSGYEGSSIGIAPSTQPPGAGDLMRFAVRLARAQLEAKIEWLFRHEQWGVGIVDQPIASLLEADVCPTAHWIDNPDRERFIADPAGVVENDGYGVFVEDLEQRQYRGKLTYYRYTTASGFEGPSDALIDPHHLSYPYIIKHENRIYCVPESSAAGEVALWEIREYPGGWQKVATLLADVPALDCTVFEHEGRWWMLGVTRVASGAYSLEAWYASDLFGPWQPHARNPLSTDIRTSRPGGKPFLHDGQLIRPAQDCSRTYGGALALMRVVRLSPTEFEEALIRVVEPNPGAPYSDGFHTAYPLGDRTLVDGKRRIFIPYVFRKAIGLS